MRSLSNKKDYERIIYNALRSEYFDVWDPNVIPYIRKVLSKYKISYKDYEYPFEAMEIEFWDKKDQPKVNHINNQVRALLNDVEEDVLTVETIQKNISNVTKKPIPKPRTKKPCPVGKFRNPASGRCKTVPKPKTATVTVKELKASAKARGLKGYSKLKKDQLIKLLA